MFKRKKKKSSTVTGRSNRRHFRVLAIEALEDRRLLAFAHPGLLHTEADFERMETKVAAGAQPWVSGWNALVSHGYSQLGADPRPLETVIRGGTGQNFNQMVIDIQRAYMTALRWKVSGDTRYADQSVEFLNAWSSTMTTLTGNADRFLAAGIYGYQWANVAEIMRTYDGWAQADVDSFKNWLLDIYYPMNHDFLVNHNTAAITNYWANWDLCNMASILAIGIFTDRQDLYDEATDYFYNGAGNGAVDKFVYYIHDGYLGQWQESGRDQGHTVFGVSLVGPFMQMAWNQGLDLFSYGNNRFLAGAEYVAKYNLGYDVPFEQYSWGTGQSGTWQTHTVVSNAARGHAAPGFELVYNHYVNRMGVAAPYSEERVELLAPEQSGTGDQLGFGTLTYTLDPIAPGISKPSGLTALKQDGTVKLNWWGAVYATGYNVYRATSADGAYTQIAANISDLLTYADYGMSPGEYFYKVAGIIAGAETDFSNVVHVNTAPELIAQLPFDETSGTAAPDSTGNGVSGTLVNGASWTAGRSGNAVSLSGAAQYVSLPDDVTEDLSDFTIATWVYVNSTTNWMRIFDFGDSNGRYMYLTPRSGGGVARFAIGTNYWYNEDAVNAAAPLPTNQWVHVAVSLSGNVARLFVNGQVVGANTAMNLTPFQVGSTSQNWIGRSNYSADPYLNGRVDDFRIYNGALSTGEIYELATSTTPPAVPAPPASLTATAVVGNQINLSWSSTAAAYYTVRRAAQPSGPYTTLATLLTGTTYADSGRTADTTYHYVVTAANAGGESAFSPLASATALPPLPGVPVSLGAGPYSLTAIQLSWTAAANATGYNVKRADVSGGPYTTVASGVAATEYVDTGLTTGTTYYYVVSAVNSAGESAISNQASAAPASPVHARLKFDESRGTTATDSSGNGWNGTLVNGATWVAGRIENAVILDGVNDYVNLPSGVASELDDFTISTWVYLDASSNWARVFDFGTGSSVNMFLTPRSGADGYLRYAITTGGSGAEQRITTTTTFPSGAWTHVTVTWAANVGVLYVNGAEVGRNNSLTLSPAALGTTTLNYIGRSQYADPYLDGRVDDFRIMNRALSAAEVLSLASVPQIKGDYNLDGVVDAADYVTWRDRLGQPVLNYTGPDGDDNGLVDQGDYALWKANFGNSLAVGSASGGAAGQAALEPLVADAALAELAAPVESGSANLAALLNESVLADRQDPFAAALAQGFALLARDEGGPNQLRRSAKTAGHGAPYRPGQHSNVSQLLAARRDAVCEVIDKATPTDFLLADRPDAAEGETADAVPRHDFSRLRPPVPGSLRRNHGG